jgi:hypothetical protein
MQHTYDFITTASPIVLIVMGLGYYLNAIIKKRIDGMEERLSAIANTSLDIKKDLRNEERAVLVAFRVNLLKWEDFLLRDLVQFANQSASQADINKYYQRDNKLFLAVEISAVKASIYLCEENLERTLMTTITRIRELYSPLIGKALPRLIHLQSQLIAIDIKIKRFQASGLTDPQFAPTAADLDQHQKNTQAITQVVKDFADALPAQYEPIAKQLLLLKSAINKYLYRPMSSSSIDDAASA